VLRLLFTANVVPSSTIGSIGAPSRRIVFVRGTSAEHDIYNVLPPLRWLVADFLPPRAGFETGSGHIGFEVDKWTLGQVFSECLRSTSDTFYRLCKFEVFTAVILGCYTVRLL
jgi:hypothetical protein